MYLIKKLITTFIIINIIFVIPTYAKKGDSPETIMKKYFQACLKEDLKTLKEIVITHFREDDPSKERIEEFKMWGQFTIWMYAENKYNKRTAVKNINEVMIFKQIIQDDKALVIFKNRGKKELLHFQFNFKKINEIWVNVGILSNEDDKEKFGSFKCWEENDREIRVSKV